MARTVKFISKQAKRAVKRLHHGNDNLLRPIYYWLVNDKTEQITEKNIFAVLQKLGLRTSRNHAREFFKTLDPLGIGSVSYVDFEIWYMDE